MDKIVCILILIKIISLTSAQLEPTCFYENDANGEYTCTLSNGAVFPNTEGDDIVIKGTLDDGKNDTDVLRVVANNAATEYILNPIFNKFVNLKSLELPLGIIDNITSDYFKNCNNLEKLLISGSIMKVISASVFSACSKLKELYLSGNTIGSLNKDAFLELANLTIIKLDDNQIFSIPSNVFDPLVNLKVLDLSNNTKLKGFNNDVFKNNVELTELYIADDEFETLKKEYFDGLVKLTTLDATNSKVDKVEEAVFDKLTALSVAKFRSNICINEDFANFQRSDVSKFQVCIDNFNGSSMIIISKLLLFIIIFLKVIS